MSKKRLGAVFLALLMCGLVSQASAQDAEPKFKSNGDDLTKIRGVLEEFREGYYSQGWLRPNEARAEP
jgi:hypothetical protein